MTSTGNGKRPSVSTHLEFVGDHDHPIRRRGDDFSAATGLRFAQVAIDQSVMDRAVEVQGLLADRGQHRGANVPDLVVAAAAERAGLTVLHYDADFELIATVTQQLTEWVVPRGSVD